MDILSDHDFRQALLGYLKSQTELNEYMLRRYKEDEAKNEERQAKMQELLARLGMQSDGDIEIIPMGDIFGDEEDDDEDDRP